LSGKSLIEPVFPALTTDVGADPEETPSHEAVQSQLFSTRRDGLPEVLINSEPSQQETPAPSTYSYLRENPFLTDLTRSSEGNAGGWSTRTPFLMGGTRSLPEGSRVAFQVVGSVTPARSLPNRGLIGGSNWSFGSSTFMLQLSIPQGNTQAALLNSPSHVNKNRITLANIQRVLNTVPREPTLLQGTLFYLHIL
jgi:hypothetical protein